MDESVVAIKSAAPPPIFIQGVTNFKGMMDRLGKMVALDSIITKAIDNNVVKFYPTH